jgi:hypothetical protein
MAPTLATTPYYVESPAQPSGAGDTNTLVTPSFTPANGEVIVIKVTTWDTGTASGTPSGGSQTYTSQVTEAPGGFNAYCRIFTTVISGSPGSMTITLSAPAASCYHSMCVERWTSAQLAGTPATDATASTGAPSSTITTVAANSVVSWVGADVNSINPSTRAYRSSATEDGFGDGHVNTSGVYYDAYQTAASAGSQTYGLTAPTGQKTVMAAIEVQASSGAATPAPQPAIVAPSLAAIQAGVW